ncbi:MAG: efflux RND transporter periplasmic adaptor subunit [Firmicutes bacterium]|nr:efflux RND transporter periplasmic adaptor subunit [Bacillota bacterium]MBR6350997.1 efflux RND transporter periplasmic adaptor subunit [Bacillota bacterium]
MIKKILIILLAAALLMAMGSCGENKQEAPEASEEISGVAVQVRSVSVADISSENTVSGRIVRSSESSVYIPGTARCTAVYVSAGTEVKAGDKLLKIDMDTLDSAGSGNAALDQVNLLQLQTNMAKRSWDAARALYDVGAASQLEVQSAEAQYLGAKLQLDQALSSLGTSMMQLSYTQTGISNSASTIDEDGTVRAAIDGKVLSVSAKNGNYLSASIPAAVIQGGGHNEVSLSVSESLLPKLSTGAAVQVSVPSVNAEFEGTILSIDQNANIQTKLYAVNVMVPDDIEDLVSGMFADVTFFTENVADAVVVPSEAILSGDSGEYVFIVVDNKARYVSISTGLIGNGMTEVTSGLSEGDKLVVVGQSYLKDGDAVRIVAGE